MLLTTCPNCSAQFKVQPEQLNVRQGRVMCGRCRNVFNAFQSLTRVPESEATDSPAPVVIEPLTNEPAPDLTDSIFLREEPPPLSPEFSQTDFPSDVRTHAAESSSVKQDDAVVTGETPDKPALSVLPPLLPAADGGSEDTANNLLLAQTPAPRKYMDADHARLWSAGAAFLFLGLMLQGAFAFRSTLIQTYPQLRPAYVSACEWAGCSLSWGREDAAIRIEASDLIESPGKAGNIQLAATLVNRGVTPQDLPAIELKLTDHANQVILSRILLPHEYLGRTPAKEESLVPNVEMYVNLNIVLAGKMQASGYGVRAFYN